MKAKYLLLALSVVFLASCAKNNVKDEDKDAIKFSAVAGKAVKGTVVTTSSINAFKVRAYTAAGALFMNNVEVTKDGTTWTYSPTQFWPEEKLNFYSVSPVSQAVDYTTVTAPQIKDFEVAPNCSNQVDLLYAFNKEESKPASSATPVSVNFRHALSQVVFAAKNTNSALKVTVNSVIVASIQNKGTLTFPTLSTTSPDYSSAVNGTNDTQTDESWGKWTLAADKLNFAADMATASTELATVGTSYALSKSDSPLLLMPQTLTAWDIENDETNAAGNSYFIVNCKLENVAVDDAGSKVYTTLYDGDVAIPVSGTWKQGKKYTYTFIFGEGGGYVPPTDPDEPGDPVLVPITFTVTVDEFQQGNPANEDVDME